MNETIRVKLDKYKDIYSKYNKKKKKKENIWENKIST